MVVRHFRRDRAVVVLVYGTRSELESPSELLADEHAQVVGRRLDVETAEAGDDIGDQGGGV